ncbi:uncharacterized protein LOC115961658 [Quercus lobata]|uniref:uncharacterized protein LOC115961658 n=1 Tax=Quercus lobata TaxID=97700 RepID=UPI00124497DD|nr:uncharacterized protein LOC115961658 [Quercus lobata]
MGIKRKPPTSLFDLLEGQMGKGAQGTPQSSAPSPPPQPQTIQTRSSSTKSQPQSPRPKLPAPPQPALPPRPEPTDSKRKRSPKEKEAMDGEKSQSSKERDEAPRVKQLKIGHQSKGKETEAQSAQSKGKGIEAQSLPSAWLPAPMLHGGPLLETASMRDLGDGEGDATRTLKTSKDDLAKAKDALKEAIRERDNTSAGLDGAQKQAEEQTKRLLEAKDQLQIAKEQINDLKKRLITAENAKGVAEYARDETLRAKQEAKFARNEAEAARDKAKDEGYNTGVAETQASLKAQIPGVCRLYCSQAESIFYPPAIREAASASSEAVSDQHEAGVTQSEAAQISVPPSESLKGGELHDVIEAPESMDPEVPKEDAEPMAIPLTEVPKSIDTDPAQSSPEGTVLQGVEVGPVLPSQDVADTELKK